MLLELRLENYAVIDNVAVEFASGLNLLTGETGAGKSILIDALSLLLGDKASSEVIRSGAERAVISAVFELDETKVAPILEQNGIDGEEGSLVLRREIAAGGKGRVFVNNQPATVSVLKALSAHLATVHAQNESILAFDAAVRLALLDAFSGTDLEAVCNAFAAWNGIQRRMLELESDEQDRLRLVDLWTFQRRDIEEAKPQPGEDQRLEAEKRVLANAEKIYNLALNAFDLLYEGERSTSSSLRAAQKNLEELARYEPKFRARDSAHQRGGRWRDLARLCRRHSGLARAPGRSRRPARVARSPQAQVWADSRRRNQSRCPSCSQTFGNRKQGRSLAKSSSRSCQSRGQIFGSCPRFVEETSRGRPPAGKISRSGNQ